MLDVAKPPTPQAQNATSSLNDDIQLQILHPRHGMADDDLDDNAPLIAREDGAESIHSEGGAEDGPAERPLTAFVWAFTFTVSVSGLLFGYDTGVVSSLLVSIGTDLSQRELTTLDKSLITASTSLFALLASPIAGILADRYGRKAVISIADILFVGGALWQASTQQVWGMVVGRSIVGLAIGAASLVTPLYISELAPSQHRGRLVTSSVLWITGGQVIAYLVGWGLSYALHGWRWVVGLGAAPAALQFGLIVFLPETPRWLVKVRRVGEARTALNKVYGQGTEAVVDRVIQDINAEVVKEEGGKDLEEHGLTSKNTGAWFGALRNKSDELFSIGGNRRALTIACLLQSLQQLCGFNSLMYFSATIFSQVGFSNPTLVSLSVAGTNFLFTTIAMTLIDRVGRRHILIQSIPVMILGLLLAALSFNFLPTKITNHFFTSVNPTKDTSDITSPWAIVIVLAMVVYVSAFALGLGNVPWQQSELFPLSIRSLGSGISTATNWGSNFVVGLTFLPMMDILSPTWTFVSYAVVCGLGWIAVWRIYPETKGMSLEEVSGLLEKGWGVEESLKRVQRRR